MKIKKLIATTIMVFAILLIGCAKDEFQETLGICPEVISTSPANLETNVVVGKIISVTFNKEMNPETITDASFTIILGTVPITGTITYSGSTALFKPTVDLAENTTYIGKVTTAAKDLKGNALQTDYIWTFSTGAIVRPLVVATDPANNATGVPFNKIITATFNSIMDITTINATTFTIRQGATIIAGTVTYSGVTAVFTPTLPLSPSLVYTGTITTGAKDLAGIALLTNYVWSFTTAAIPPPTVIATDPLSNATGVVLNKVVSATFSVPMDPATINTTTFTLRQNTTTILGVVTYSVNTAFFTPSAPLLPNTVYTATITTGARNLGGIALVSNYTWNFTTLLPVAPIVTATDPANNASAVALNKIVTATFNMAMDPLTINVNTFTVRVGANSVVGVISYNGLTASFNPTGNLLPNTTYTATITTGARNVGGVALASNYIWTFSTVVVPNLGSASIFGAFGGNAGITNQGLNTVINNGSIATTAASTLITGFHDSNAIYTETPLNVGNVTGSIFTAPPAPGTAASFAIATQGLADANAAYLSISPASMPGGTDPGAGELGGLTLAPGIYKSASGTFKISNGNLTLDAQGNPNAVWIFQTAAGLTVGVAGPNGAKSVNMINGGLAKNVFWYVGSAAVINGAGGGIMTGTIIASAGVTFSTAGNAVQTVLNGRAISLVASVTMVNTTINVPN